MCRRRNASSLFPVQFRGDGAMNEPVSHEPPPVTRFPQDEPARYTPDGYRAGIITAISVLVGFSLAFLRYWGFEAPGSWSWHFVLSPALMLRSMLVEDHESPHYRVTVRWFVWGVVVMVAGLVFAAAEVSRVAHGFRVF